MKYFLLFILFSIHSLLLASPTVRINFSQNFTFNQNIIKTQSSILSGQQFIFVLFEDSTISKFTTGMVEVQSISIPSLSFIDFQVCPEGFRNILTPSIVLITNGRNQLVLMSLLNTSHQFSFNYKTNIRYISPTKIHIVNSSYYLINALLFYEDMSVDYKNINGAQSEVNLYNMTSNIGGPFQPIDKVYYSSHGTVDLYTVRTVKRAMYTQSGSYMPTDYTYSIHGRVSVNTTFNTISGFTMDKGNLYLAQDLNGTVSGKYVYDWYDFTIDPLILSGIGSSRLISVRPISNAQGERIIILNDKTMKVSLVNRVYNFVSIVQQYSNTPLTNDMEILSISSGALFLYTKNSPKIYGYCEGNYTFGTCVSTPWNVVRLMNCSTIFANCLNCNQGFTACLSCISGYELFNDNCYQDRPCAVANCDVCHSNQTCVHCINNWNLSVNNSCYDPTIINPPTNTNNHATTDTATSPTMNTTMNTTMHTTTNPPSNPPSNATTDPPSNTQNNKPTEYQAVENKTGAWSDQDEQFLFTKIAQIFEAFEINQKTIAKSLSVINCSPAIRTMFPFLFPLFSFFDDYWYYIYHSNSYRNLDVFRDGLVFMYIANSQRIVPSFLQFQSPIQPALKDASRFVNYTNNQVLSIDEQPTYLINNINDMVFQQYFVLLLFFVAIKLLSFFIKTFIKIFMSQQNEPNQENQSQSIIFTGMKRFHEFLEMKLSLKSIMLSFIGSNLIFLAFTFSVQLKFIFGYVLVDRFNVLATLSLGFVKIAFTLMILMYHDMYLYDKNKIFNLNTNKNLKASYNYEKYENYSLTFIVHFKCIADGFIHGYFLNQNPLQYVILIQIKLCILITIFMNSHLIKRSKQYYLSIGYYLVGIGIDALCLCSKMSWISANMLNEVFSGFSYLKCLQLSLVGGSVICVVLSLLAQFSYEIYDSFCRNKSLSDEDKKDLGSKIIYLEKRVFPQTIENKQNLSPDLSLGIKQRFLKIKKIKQITYENGIYPHYLAKVPSNQNTTKQNEIIFSHEESFIGTEWKIKPQNNITKAREIKKQQNVKKYLEQQCDRSVIDRKIQHKSAKDSGHLKENKQKYLRLKKIMFQKRRQVQSKNF